MKRASSFAAFLAASAVAACSGGGESTSGATVIGRVQTELGIGLTEASVSLDGSSTTSDEDGAFELGSKAGTRTLDVQRVGYRRVTADVRIANGDNRFEVTMVPCTPGEDAGCPTQTPTPTATPSPTPNVLASFDGTNANVATLDFDPWIGAAALDGATTTWSLGDATDAEPTGSDLAYSECWADAGETATYNGGALDHCVFWWDGASEGIGGTDAIFYVRIPGAVYVETVPNTITFSDGMTAGYYEGEFDGNQLHIVDYELLHEAVEGSLVLEANGLTQGQPVKITGQATFRIPTLP